MNEKQINPAKETSIPAKPQPEAPSPAQSAEAAKAGEKGMTWMWRISGGMLLLAATFVAVAVHQNMDRQIRQLNKQLSELNQELRRDLGRLSETQGAMVKKDDHTSKIRRLWDTLKQMSGDHTDLARVHERCVVLQEMGKNSDEDRKQMTEEIRKLREAQAGSSDKESLTREIRVLRERLSQLETKPVVVPAKHVERPNSQ